MSNETTEKRATHRCRRCGALWGQLADWAKISGTKDCWEHPLSDLEIITPQDEPRAAPSASPALVEGERQELLGKEGAEALARNTAAYARAIHQELCGGQQSHHGMCSTALAIAKQAGRLAAAPPISLEEQAQPDAQDLTEEEIARVDRLSRDPRLYGIDAELLSRLLATEKRRRGIK